MNPHTEQSFLIAESAIGYPLSSNSTPLSRRVEQDGTYVLEVTEIWAGVVQRVRHISPKYRIDGIVFRDGAFEVQYNGEGTCLVERRGNATEVIEPGQSFGVPRDAIVHVRNGTHHRLYRVVPAGRKIGLDPIAWIDVPFLSILAFALVLGISFLTMVVSLPGEPIVQAQDIGDRFARVMLAKQKPPRQKPVRSRIREVKSAGPKEGGGSQAKRSKGTKRVEHSAFARNRLQRNDTIGILGAMKRGNVLSPFQVDDTLVGNIQVSAHGEPSGSSRLGARSKGFGSGPGIAAGYGDGLTAGLGIAGDGGLGGTCTGPDGMCEKRTGRVTVEAESMIAVGSLSRAEVDQVVKGHLKRIKYCYQRQMQSNPTMAGKITTRFTVSQDGSVGTARVVRSSMGNDAVERCLVKTLFRMTFPKPRGGGHVIVTYPFTFDPS